LEANQVDIGTNQVRAHPAPCEDRLVLIKDLFIDQQNKRVVVDPISQRTGARHKRLSLGVLECSHASHKDGSVNDASRVIPTGKSRAARRYVDTTTETKQIMESRMKGDSPWVLPSTRKPGAPIGRLNSAHDRLVAKAAEEGVDIGFVMYDFRHTLATNGAQNGTDLSTLAALLGHGPTRCVTKYVHPTADHKKMAMKRYDRTMKQAKNRTKSHGEG
jgi:site-specific recombinase XerD